MGEKDMPAIDVITGLRGAGKTTVINRILKEAYAGARISVIQNELGKVSLESPLLINGEASLEQMTGGCVCCTLQTNLLEGIRRQMETARPDTIILEAAGEGRPSDILRLCDYQKDLLPHLCLHVIDGSRYQALRSLMGNALTAPIKQSRLLYVNRLTVHPERTADVFRDLRILRPDVTILHDAPGPLPEEFQNDSKILSFSVAALLSLAEESAAEQNVSRKTVSGKNSFVRMRFPT